MFKMKKVEKTKIEWDAEMISSLTVIEENSAPSY